MSTRVPPPTDWFWPEGCISEMLGLDFGCREFLGRVRTFSQKSAVQERFLIGTEDRPSAFVGLQKDDCGIWVRFCVPSGPSQQNWRGAQLSAKGLENLFFAAQVDRTALLNFFVSEYMSDPFALKTDVMAKNTALGWMGIQV